MRNSIQVRELTLTDTQGGNIMNIYKVRRLVPFAAAFDIAVAVAVFGGYIDPTLRVVGAVTCAVCVVGALYIYFND